MIWSGMHGRLSLRHGAAISMELVAQFRVWLVAIRTAWILPRAVAPQLKA